MGEATLACPPRPSAHPTRPPSRPPAPQFLPKTLRLTFEEGIKMLQEAGYDVSPSGGAALLRLLSSVSSPRCMLQGGEVLGGRPGAASAEQQGVAPAG